MPFPKRKIARKTTRKPMYARRKRVYRKKRYTKGVMHFKRTVDLANAITTNNSVYNAFSYTFKFSDLPGVTDFASLFDQYRINCVVFTVYPQVDQFGSNSIPSLQIFSVVDYDDDGTPISLNEFNQYANLQRRMFTRPFTRKIYPTAIQTGVNISSANNDGFLRVPRKTWFDMANRDIKFFGHKFAICPATATGSVGYTCRVTCTYYFSCKGIR